MAVRYYTRLTAVLNEETGLFRLKLAHPNTDGRAFIIVGPDVVIPPDIDMNRDEVDQFVTIASSLPGYHLAVPEVPMSPNAIIEGRLTFEDIIPPGSVQATLGGGDLPSGEKTLAVRIVSRWNRSIPKFTIRHVIANQEPHPEPEAPGDTKWTGLVETPLAANDDLGPDLCPRTMRIYYVPPGSLPAMRSRAACLSPEHHWLSLQTEGFEFDRIAGGEVAGVLDALDI